MTYCTIFYVSWELNECLRKTVFRHNSNRLRMHRRGGGGELFIGKERFIPNSLFQAGRSLETLEN